MHRRVLLFLLLLALFVLMAQPAAALFVRLPGDWVADVTLCRDGYSVNLTGIITTTGDNVTANVTSVSIPAQIGEIVDITATTDNQAVDVTKFFAWNSPQAPGTVVDMTMDRWLNGALLDERTADAPEAIQDCYINPPSGGIFLGDPQDLILIVNDAVIYDAPNGNPITTIEACKTAFVLTREAGFVEIVQMGGWIDAVNTVDVAEDYGQPGGAPTWAGC